MSRGTSKAKVVDAVLAGLSTASGMANGYAIAESVVRSAQPCRVDIGLELGPSKGKGRAAALCREVRVLGLAGGLHATVIPTEDGRPATVTGALQALRAATRRRKAASPYRMVALPIEGDEAGFSELHKALERELGSRAAQAEVFFGSPVNIAGRMVTPAVVVVS